MVADHLHHPLPLSLPSTPQAPDDPKFIHTSNPNQTSFKPSSMVLIRDSLHDDGDCSVFPPINHENLHPIPLQHHFLSPPSSSSSSSSLMSSSFSPSDVEYSDPDSPLHPETRVQKSGSKVTNWVGFGFEVLCSKFMGFASSFWCRFGIQSVGSGLGIVGVVLVVWSFYMRSRQRRSREKLRRLVKQKDEKIFQLLHQIAELNEVLVARQRLQTN